MKRNNYGKKYETYMRQLHPIRWWFTTKWHIVRRVPEYGLRFVYDTQYRQDCNRRRRNIHTRDRKIRLMGTTGLNRYRKVTKRTKRKILNGRDAGECEMCRNTFPKERLTIDHIVPVSKGGGNERSNLQMLCQPCHSEKDTQKKSQVKTQEHWNQPFTVAFKTLHDTHKTVQ